MRPLSQLNYDWAVRCFGLEHVHDRRVRALRLLEEAIELAQSVGVPREQVELCTGIVYQKPPGNPRREAEGVAVTATLFATVHLQSEIEALLLDALRTVSAKPPEYYAERNERKIKMGLTG